VADNDSLELQCPCCLATLGFDDAGDPFVISSLAPNERQGVRGIVVEESTPGWQDARYKANSQTERDYLKYQVAVPFVAPPVVDVQDTEEKGLTEEDLLLSAAIQEANHNDLKHRSIL
jgi:hypothetical protein